MGPSLGPALANAYIAYLERKELESCSFEYRPVHY